MQIVKQQDKTGCGLACVVALLQTEYQLIKNVASQLFNWSERKKVFRTTPKQLMKLLKHYEIEVTLTTLNDCETSTTAKVLGVNLDEKGNFHWVILIHSNSGNLIFDPETAELYQYESWLNVDNGYLIDIFSKMVISTDLSVGEIKI